VILKKAPPYHLKVSICWKTLFNFCFGKSAIEIKNFQLFVSRLGEKSQGCLDPSGGIIMADKALKLVQV
jgi:hypothetical protein